MKLTKEKNVSDVFEFEGSRNIMILGGNGILTLERSIRNSEFHPLSTDIGGGVAIFECNGGCAYNGNISEDAMDAKYRWVADMEDGEIEIIMSRTRR